MEAEEVYWQQRGSEKWVLEGDSNSSFFHLVANGRKRKKSILSLEHEGEVVTDPGEYRKSSTPITNSFLVSRQLELSLWGRMYGEITVDCHKQTILSLLGPSPRRK